MSLKKYLIVNFGVFLLIIGIIFMTGLFLAQVPITYQAAAEEEEEADNVPPQLYNIKVS